MRTAIGISGLGLALALSAGCGNTVNVLTGGAGGTSSVSTADGAPGSTSSGATSGTGGACTGFTDAAGQGKVVVRFENKGGVPIYLPANCSDVAFTIDPVGAPSNASFVYDKSCLQTCADLQTQPQYACGACAPRSYRLDPGASRDVEWDGTGLEQATMPLACWKQPFGNQTQCGRIIDAPTGAYGIQAMGYAECGPGCTCDAQGVCDGIATGAQAYADPAKLSYPADGLVEVVFGVCAFPCPGG